MKNITRRQAKRKGWAGPYRYRMPSARGVTHGWLLKRGRKWLYFYSVTYGRMRLPIDEEAYMEKIK